MSSSLVQDEILQSLITFILGFFTCFIFMILKSKLPSTKRKRGRTQTTKPSAGTKPKLPSAATTAPSLQEIPGTTAPSLQEIPYKEEEEEVKMVLVIRMDLAMGKGKVAAQASHAALAAYQISLKQDNQSRKWIQRWEHDGTAKVTLKCMDETEMLQLQRHAKSKGIVAYSVVDAGRTQIAAGSRTVLAIGPAPKSLINQVTGHLKLY